MDSRLKAKCKTSIFFNLIYTKNRQIPEIQLEMDVYCKAHRASKNDKRKKQAYPALDWMVIVAMGQKTHL